MLSLDYARDQAIFLLDSSLNTTKLRIYMKNIIKIISLLGLCLFLLSSAAQAQKGKDAWESLADVKFKSRMVDGYEIDSPVFGSKVKALQSKQIYLKGYVLPLEVGDKKQFIFSLYPYNLCYFCGGAGPETVVEVQAKSPIAYCIKPIIIKGRLRLNAKDYNHLMYILEDAEEVD